MLNYTVVTINMGIVFALLGTVLATILLAAILIIPHELGHFGAARLFGIRPKSFSIGVGKTLYKKEQKGTEYIIKLLPIGGSIVIDDDDEKFIRLNTFKKCLIIAAGAFMNLLTAMIIVVVIALFFTPLIPTMQIGEIYPEATQNGYMTGLHNEDIITKVNGRAFSTIYDLNYYLALEGVDKFNFEVTRSGKSMVIEDVRLPIVDTEGIKGANIFSVCGFIGDDPTFFDSISFAMDYLKSLFAMVASSFKALFTGKVPITAMSSIVGVGQIVSEQIGQQDGALLILSIIGMVSVSLTVVNLLPIPALDGGHIIIMAFEGISGKKVSERVLKIINRIFYIALSVLSLGLVILDLLKMFNVI